MASAEIITVIDLGPYLPGTPGAINRAAENLHFAQTQIGFYFIVNHGVPSEQIQAVLSQAERFHALPLQKKLEVKLDKHNVGYLPMRGDTFRTSLPADRSRRLRNTTQITCRRVATGRQSCADGFAPDTLVYSSAADSTRHG